MLALLVNLLIAIVLGLSEVRSLGGSLLEGVERDGDVRGWVGLGCFSEGSRKRLFRSVLFREDLGQMWVQVLSQ